MQNVREAGRVCKTCAKRGACGKEWWTKDQMKTVASGGNKQSGVCSRRVGQLRRLCMDDASEEGCSLVNGWI